MKHWVAVLLSIVCLPAVAVSTFDPESGVLKLDSVVLGDTQYNDVTVRLDRYTVLGVRSSQPYGRVSQTCLSANFTKSNFDAIKPGMSREEVERIMGCAANPNPLVRYADYSVYRWYSVEIGAYDRSMIVTFDSEGRYVIDRGGYYKQAYGF